MAFELEQYKISPKEAQEKLQEYWFTYFSHDSAENLFIQANETEAFIITPDTNDIRSEGMSYGMMIAVLMNEKETFDQLWTFAVNHMQHQEGARSGYFAWQLSAEAPYSIMDPNPAPDGEEYFVTALFFAAKLWGNGEGILNYEDQANRILHEMIHKMPGSEQNPMWNPTHHQVVFTTDPHVDSMTDPSYHLPAFYLLWAKWAAKDKEYWEESARISRIFFRRCFHPLTGLTPNYANFDGSPYAASWVADHDHFGFDAFRSIMNLAMDWDWFKSDSWQQEIAEVLLTFFHSRDPLVCQYTLDGKPLPETHPATPALIAMNATAALASRNQEMNQDFIRQFWNMSLPTGKYRYYNAMLGFLAALHLSGKFHAFLDL